MHLKKREIGKAGEKVRPSHAIGASGKTGNLKPATIYLVSLHGGVIPFILE
jgi:hypothetical protein